jgi:hypothetical protein
MVQAMAEHLQQRPELLPGLLTSLFEIVLFEDCSNQWSLSRPMLSLILVNEQIYSQLQVLVSIPAISFHFVLLRFWLRGVQPPARQLMGPVDNMGFSAIPRFFAIHPDGYEFDVHKIVSIQFCKHDIKRRR